jgi:hypothetical protein
LRSVAIPVEHGGWAFLLQPAVLGFLLQPSWGGLLLGLAALSAFLARHPLKIALGDRRKGKRYARTALAERMAALYLALAALAFLPAPFLAQGPFWIPLLIAAPLVLIQQYYDVRKKSRELAAELAGALALGSLAPAIAVAGGWTLAQAMPVWPLLAAQCAPAILYARARLRLERGQASPPGWVWAAHAAGLLAAIGLAWLSLTPWLGAAAMAVMLVRAMIGLSRFRRPATATRVGVQEVLFSALTVALIAIGYWANL